MINPEQILYGYYIKYNKLRELTLQEFANTPNANATKVNIYIDLYDMLYSLYTSKVNIQDTEAITATILNLAGHLRGYFRKTHRVDTKIYLIYGATNSDTQEKLIFGGYNRKGKQIISENPRINKSILEVFSQLELLCKYIDEVYFIQVNEFESSVIIFDRILKEEAVDASIPNIIITKSLYAYQIPAYTINTRIYRPFKSKGEDKSYIVNKSNCLFRYVLDRRSSTGINEELNNILTNLNPELISFIMTLAGIYSRGVKPIINITSTLREINKMIENQVIINGYNSIIDYPINAYRMHPTLVTNKIEIISRYKGIDLRMQHMLFMNSVYIQTIDQSIIDLIDDEGFRYISGKYFSKYPLDVNNL